MIIFIFLFYLQIMKGGKFNSKKMKNIRHIITISHYHRELKRIVVVKL